jgi:16S rRNA (guanine(966)-N(2))-methyltransferase RsmD
LRIISGKFKSIQIPFNKSIKARPTTSSAKEALFNILENKDILTDSEVLDLFSGTGGIAYEFISRGANSVICVDRNISSIKFIRSIATKHSMNITTFRADALKFILKTKKKSLDIIFADPPYNQENIQKIPELILNSGILKKNGLLNFEHSRDVNFQESTNFIEKRTYSSVNFSFFKIKSEK